MRYLLLVLLLIFTQGCFSLFDRNKIELKRLETSSGFIEVAIISTGATTEDVMEIRNKNNNGSEKLLLKTKPYDEVLNMKVSGDTLYILCRDTIPLMNVPDTISVFLNNNYSEQPNVKKVP